MANQVTLTFAGDEQDLVKASKKSSDAVESFGKSAQQAGDDLTSAGKSNDDYLTKVGKLGAGVDGLSGAFDDAGGVLQGFIDLQNSGFEKTQRLARASNDVAQAQEDYAQALRDSKQAAIDSDQAVVDLEQAQLDAATALRDYNQAVKEHGRNSLEARQAQIDLKQAGVDVKQAQEDSAQATRDASQATIDAKGATLDLAEAQKEANPPDISQWSSNIEAFTPILSGLTGVVGLVTAAQWAWNASLLASPVTWIVLGIAAIVAGIVLLVKNWDTVKKAGAAAWDWIKHAASNSWDFLKKIPGWLGSAFKGLANVLSWPFRTAFNFISDAWNHTIGSLHWTVPGWVPFVGGNTISVPNLPKFHTGISSVPGAPGAEMLAVLEAGERITPAGGGGGDADLVHAIFTLDGDVLVDAVTKGFRGRLGAANV